MTSEWVQWLNDQYDPTSEGGPMPEILKKINEATAPYGNTRNNSSFQGWKVLSLAGILVVLYYGMQ